MFSEPNINAADGTLNYPFAVNDIALLELEEEVDLTVYTPVCLARAGITESGENIIYIHITCKLSFCHCIVYTPL